MRRRGRGKWARIAGMTTWWKMTLLALVGALVVSSCRGVETTPPVVRTAVPTWTLAFEPAGPPATATAALTTSPAPVAAVTVEIATLPAATDAPTAEPTASETLVPSPSPTARPGIDPTLGASSPDPFITHEMPIPDPVAQLRLDPQIVNILLLGRDTDRTANNYRTDVIIVASINKAANSVTMLTIPRDLYLYIPGWTMNRINTAAGHGEAIGYPGGGVALLQQTILYNLGLPIHGWARVDFEGFRNVVDIVGGVDLPVSCAMQDWRLIDPSLDDQNADNWQLYTVETGVQHMDGDLALWYARSRKRSSDFDRSRRQHQVLRAIFDKALRLEMLSKVPELYGQYLEVVDTDMGLGDLLQFVPMATQLERARIKSRFIGREHVFSWTTPAGAAVLLPNREAIAALMAEAFVPPSQNVLAREAPTVEIWNGTANASWQALAADNLAWAGIVPVIGEADGQGYSTTTLYDFTTSAKASAVREIQRIFRISDENVISAPDAAAPHPFRVVLGSDYNSCVAPQSIIRTTPTPFASGGPAPQGENVFTAAAVLEPPPGLEGDLAEWDVLPYPLAEPILGTGDWNGPDDASATWNAAWDEDYLYLAVNVKDEGFVQMGSAGTLHMGDSLELWFDADRTGDGGSAELNGDDFVLGLSPGNLTSPVGGPESYLWHPEEEARPIPDVIVAAELLPSGGYALEIGIPWTVLRTVPGAGKTFGFALALNDDDSPGSPDQQTQLTNRRAQERANPTGWGMLVLGHPPPAP